MIGIGRKEDPSNNGVPNKDDQHQLRFMGISRIPTLAPKIKLSVKSFWPQMHPIFWKFHTFLDPEASIFGILFTGEPAS
jgi:hypothetical protein